MRLVFAGTPEVALPSLRALVASSHEVVAVVTRPDAPSGRGRSLRPSPVAALGVELGIEVLRPDRPGDPAFQERLTELAPDACPVVAYGALVPERVLAIPRFGWVNLHFSVLPAWRGAAPVQRAIWAGDELTGATTFRLVKELDAGPVFGVLTERVKPTDTAGALLGRLAEAGAELLVATMDGIEDGSLVAREQTVDGLSYAPKVLVEEAHIDWDDPAVNIDRMIRACTPAPGAWTTLAGERVKVGPVTLSLGPEGLAPGELAVQKNHVDVGTGRGTVRLGEIKAFGKKQMPAAAWARGVRLEAGTRFGS